MNAFPVGNWACSVCPSCGLLHCEALFTFPPLALTNHFVAKASAEGIGGVVVTPLAVSAPYSSVTPLAVSAPYWSKLFRASVVDNEDGYVCIMWQSSPAGESDVAGKLTVFAVDFSQWSTRRLDPAPAPPCCLEGLFHGIDPLGSSADQEDRALIRASLVQLSLALR